MEEAQDVSVVVADGDLRCRCGKWNTFKTIVNNRHVQHCKGCCLSVLKCRC